ncbi:MAG: 3-hydroxyacyl-CoA dehydrogenase family protein [Deltaproteobacteria bacterium]|nr:3-hydroxyacyl-CoA dehydrogenase family protein [Deltaproteobacteria bacterium]
MKQAINKVAIIGSGTMGHGIAQTFAQAGYEVAMMDSAQSALERGMSLIRTSLATLADAGLVDPGQIPAILARIRPTTSIKEAASGADIAIEAVTEEEAVKKAIFAELDRFCTPEALLACNTTFLNPFAFAEVSHPERLLITHWYAPPQVIPLVDVVKGPHTSDATIELIVAVLRDLGKKPVVFKRFVAGYLVSRLQFALQREVFYLLDNDYLSAEELDEAARWGLALRMMVVGVVQRIDFGGLDLTARNLERPSFDPTPDDYSPTKIFELVKDGHLGVKTGKGFYDYGSKSEAEVCKERDVKLLKLLKLLQTL